MKNWLVGTSFFIGCYLVFLIATMPMQTLLLWIQLPHNVVMQEVKGTIWHAKIKQVLLQQSSNNPITLNKVQLQLKLLSLMSLNPSVDVQFGGKALSGPQGSLTLTDLTTQQPTIEQAKISLSADEILPYLKLPIQAEAYGALTLSLDRYQMGQPLCAQAQGQLSWRKAAAKAYGEMVELGNLSAQISCEKGALALKINPKNNLGLSFTAYLRNFKRISGNGYLTPSNKFPAALKQLLPFLGKPDHKGRYRLNW